MNDIEVTEYIEKSKKKSKILFRWMMGAIILWGVTLIWISYLQLKEHESVSISSISNLFLILVILFYIRNIKNLRKSQDNTLGLMNSMVMDLKPVVDSQQQTIKIIETQKLEIENLTAQLKNYEGGENGTTGTNTAITPE